jgi:hypothetical protein
LERDIDIVVCVCARSDGGEGGIEVERNERTEGEEEECHEVLFGRRRALVTSRDVSSYSTYTAAAVHCFFFQSLVLVPFLLNAIS